MDQIDRTRRIAMLSPVACALAFGATGRTARADSVETEGDEMRLADASATATADAAPSTTAFSDAIRKMRQGMSVPLTGNVDLDFVRAMIPLQQGAIAMAGLVRDYGDDPDVRKLAETVLARRKTELDWMTAWLHRHSAP